MNTYFNDFDKVMRKILKITVIYSTMILLTVIVDSCCPDTDTEFEWTGLTTGIVEKTVANNKVNYIELTKNEIDYDKLGLELSLNGKFVANTNIQFSLFQPINAAFDCFYYFQPKFKITKLQIVTLSDFDQIKSKNSDLSDYFKVLGNNGTLESINDFIQDKNNINGEIRDDSKFEDPIVLFLQNSPTNEGVFSFAINIQLANNTILSDTTEAIKISK